MNKFISFLKDNVKQTFLLPPRWTDTVLLTVLTVLIAYQPFYLQGRVNEFELGLYLPGIKAVLNGLLPFKDFFHLRGPLELYIPALLMRFWGENVALLSTYFYIGTLITLVLGILIARNVLQTRLVLYLMTFVFIGRTFPRVIFTFWGGMRFGWGLLSVLCVVLYLNRKNLWWIIFAGIAAGLALLTSVEMGLVCFLSVLGTYFLLTLSGLYPIRESFRDINNYLIGLVVCLVPYLMYLLYTQSLGPYVRDTIVVITQMPKAIPIHLVGDTPDSLGGLIKALWPGDPHFKHMTPAFCYLFLGIYMYKRWRSKDVRPGELSILHVAVYGLIMYVLAFRNIGAGQFEMALQPEKIVFFFLMERVFLFLRIKKKSFSPGTLKVVGINVLLALFVLSSLGYAIQRYNHRFPAFQYMRNFVLGRDTRALQPLAGQASEQIELPRARGLTVPLDQAQDWTIISDFVQKYTGPDEPVFLYPEGGFYSFLIDRPFVSRFPMATFSWFGHGWHDILMRDLKRRPPQFIILSNELPDKFDKIYFQVERNKQHYDEVMDFIGNYYERIVVTSHFSIYQQFDMSSFRT